MMGKIMKIVNKERKEYHPLSVPRNNQPNKCIRAEPQGEGRRRLFSIIHQWFLVKTKPKSTELIAIATKFSSGTVFFFPTNSHSHILNGLRNDFTYVLLLIRTANMGGNSCCENLHDSSKG